MARITCSEVCLRLRCGPSTGKTCFHRSFHDFRQLGRIYGICANKSLVLVFLSFLPLLIRLSLCFIVTGVPIVLLFLTFSFYIHYCFLDVLAFLIALVLFFCYSFFFLLFVLLFTFFHSFFLLILYSLCFIIIFPLFLVPVLVLTPVVVLLLVFVLFRDLSLL